MRNTKRLSPPVNRLRAFRAALAMEGGSVTKFAKGLRISRSHLYRAFGSPDLVAKRIHAAINQLIAKHKRAA